MSGSSSLRLLSRLTFALQVHHGLGAPADLELRGKRRQPSDEQQRAAAAVKADVCYLVCVRASWQQEEEQRAHPNCDDLQLLQRGNRLIIINTHSFKSEHQASSL